jgi:methionyl aminopeptidase
VEQFPHTAGIPIMTINSTAEFEGMRRVGQLVAATRETMRASVRPGVTTGELDAIGERFARAAGARSAPQLTYDFPGFTCISVNDEIVHGIPGPRVLADGDLVTLDVTLELDGFMADSAITVPVGRVSPEARRVMRAARQAFQQGFDTARAGVSLQTLGRAVDTAARAAGVHVFRELAGHGIGRRLHEEPTVPNWGAPDATEALHDGVVIALEPMVSARPARVVEARDGWTLRTHNRALAAHHEHTLMVRAGQPPVILTAA